MNGLFFLSFRKGNQKLELLMNKNKNNRRRKYRSNGYCNNLKKKISNKSWKTSTSNTIGSLLTNWLRKTRCPFQMKEKMVI